jgi:hypothetical protein
MEKTYTKGTHTGYKIGNDIFIRHIYDPESWFLTVRSIQIYANSLCKKTCSEQEIKDKIKFLLQAKWDWIGGLLKDITDDKI